MPEVWSEHQVPLCTIPNRDEQDAIEYWLKFYGAVRVRFSFRWDEGVRLRYEGPFTAENCLQLVWGVIMSISPRLLEQNGLH